MDETHLRFYVADTGLGIDPEMQAQIFDRFIKLNTFVHGTGLGLSISKSIIAVSYTHLDAVTEVSEISSLIPNP